MGTNSSAGVYAIASTPFLDDGRIDEHSIDRLTDFFLKYRMARPCSATDSTPTDNHYGRRTTLVEPINNITLTTKQHQRKCPAATPKVI